MSIIIRYSEISLKGKNRPEFENKLTENIKQCLSKYKHPYHQVIKTKGRIIIETNKNLKELVRVFGISSFSFAKKTKYSLDNIKKELGGFLQEIKKGNTFRVTTKRVDKSIKETSMDIDKEIGAHIILNTGAKVDLKRFDTEVLIEIIDAQAYIVYETIKGFSGLPLGTSGKATSVIRDQDSLLRALMMMKRGCSLSLFNPDKKQIKLLEKYNNSISFKNTCDIDKDNQENALIDDIYLYDKKNLEHNTKKIILDPLVGLNDGQRQELFNIFKDERPR